ncbi:MAG TPA: HPF/RaiA family ribosome-associated protein, partial [Candidatus Angelobacter sp.]
MNVHISYKAGKTPDVEREFKHQLEKLERRLQVFRPELVHFHAILELQNGHSARASLNLRLPSGQMAAQKSGDTVLAAIKNAFTDLLSQLNKHKELLRGNWNWKRRRASGGRDATDVALEQPTALPQPRTEQAEPENRDVSTWINANLQKLEKFVDRELRYRIATQQIHEDQISREEVIDEVMVSVLSHEESSTDDLPLESRLYRLALRAVRRVAEDNADIATVSLDAPAGMQNVSGSDENVLQYHQPD